MHGSIFLKSARALAIAGAAVALVATALALAGSSTALGQDTPDCEITDLGTLGSSAGSALAAEGRWTTEDCDSRFRAGSDAHTYRFQVGETGRIRVDLSSAEADAYLYLLNEDGSRITDNDDSGAQLDARIEGDLEPGTYMIEATTVGGRGRGPADFTLTVSRVGGCEFVHLGTLEPGVDLTASGSWTLDTCGSRVVSRHPAHAYSFDLSQGARVRIDLESENGDPVLSLASLEHASCRPGPAALRGALEAAGVANIDELLALDAEMRSVRPVHGLAVDGTLCAMATVDSTNYRFLRRLSIGDSRELREMIEPERPQAPVQAPEPHRLRVIARLGDDGRVEHGVELVGGRRVLPQARFLPADANGTWQVTGDVEVQGSPIGRIRARRLAGGRTEMGFISAGGDAITPDIAYLPANLPAGVWLRSSEIDVPAAMVMDTVGGSAAG